MNYIKADLKVLVENNNLLISLKDKAFSFALDKISKSHAAATEDEKKHFRVSPSDYGILWYMVNEDISIPI